MFRIVGIVNDPGKGNIVLTKLLSICRSQTNKLNAVRHKKATLVLDCPTAAMSVLCSINQSGLVKL